MHCFDQRKVKKRLNINALKPILIIIFTICFSACSHTPKTTTSTTTPTAPAAIEKADHSVLSTPIESNSADQLYAAADSDSLWQRVREGYQLDAELQHPLIDNELAWYRKNPTFVYRATERSSRYLHYVVSAVQQRNMPTELALLPFIESAYDPFAYSRSGAAGMWQFIPQTATSFGLKRNWWYDGRKDVVASTDAALDYLQYLHDKFNNDWLLALAAYNCGEGTVQRAINANRSKGLNTDFWSLNLREETRKYVPRFLALAKVVGTPQAHGITLYSIADRDYFAAADTKGQLSLARAATLANVDIDELLRLNPGLNHATISKESPARILLPVGAFDQFTQALSALPASERVQWQHYTVAKGDTLTGLARKFSTPAAAIASANDLNNRPLKPGQTLIIPQGYTQSVIETAQATPKPFTSQTPFGSTQIFHTVQTGDNLKQLAQRYGVAIKDIQRWNGLGADAPIKLGQKLNIWTYDIGSKPAKIAANSSAKKVGYTIQNGDSLTAIANKFDIAVEDILRWNQVNPRALLQPGQRLTLFPTK